LIQGGEDPYDLNTKSKTGSDPADNAMTRSGRSRDSGPVNRVSHGEFDESFRDSTLRMNETIGGNLYDPGNSESDDDDSSSGEGRDEVDKQNRMASETLSSNNSQSQKRPKKQNPNKNASTNKGCNDSCCLVF